MLLHEEARNCRLEAKRLEGKAEAPFLLHLAEAFEELARKEQGRPKAPSDTAANGARRLTS
jgi:hypothetical protein